MRRAVLCSVALWVGCGGADAPVAPDGGDDPAPVGAGRYDAGHVVIDASPVVVDASPPASACAGIATRTYVCDSFETPTLAPAWQVIANGGGVHVQRGRAVTGVGSLAAGFGALPAIGDAAIALHDAFFAKAPLLSLRAYVWIPVDGYPTRLPLASMRPHAGGAGVDVVLRGSDTLVVADATGASAIDRTLGPAHRDAWTCVEIELSAQGTLRGWIGATKAIDSHVTSAASLATIDEARIGLRYTDGANPNASIGVSYDDVVVGTGAVGCR